MALSHETTMRKEKVTLPLGESVSQGRRGPHEVVSPIRGPAAKPGAAQVDDLFPSTNP